MLTVNLIHPSFIIIYCFAALTSLIDCIYGWGYMGGWPRAYGCESIRVRVVLRHAATTTCDTLFLRYRWSHSPLTYFCLVRMVCDVGLMIIFIIILRLLIRNKNKFEKKNRKWNKRSRLLYDTDCGDGIANIIYVIILLNVLLTHSKNIKSKNTSMQFYIIIVCSV